LFKARKDGAGGAAEASTETTAVVVTSGVEEMNMDETELAKMSKDEDISELGLLILSNNVNRATFFLSPFLLNISNKIIIYN